MAAHRIGPESYMKVLLADPLTGEPYRVSAEPAPAPVRVFGLLWQTDSASVARYAALMALGHDIPWRTACGRLVSLGPGLARTVTIEAIAQG